MSINIYYIYCNICCHPEVFFKETGILYKEYKKMRRKYCIYIKNAVKYFQIISFYGGAFMNSELNSLSESILFTYNCKTCVFGSGDHIAPWQSMLSDGLISEESSAKLSAIFSEICASDSPHAVFLEILYRNRPMSVGFISVPKESVSITFTELKEDNGKKTAEFDRLTGLPNRKTFCSDIDEVLRNNPETAANGGFAMIFFDIHRLKAINDLFGMEEGDRLLVYIADKVRHIIGSNGLLCRLTSDKYAVFVRTSEHSAEHIAEMIINAVSSFDLPFELICNVGIYITGANSVSADKMIDRASLAQSSVKGSYTKKLNYYTEELRSAMLSEHEITGRMNTALIEEQFEVYYQPQYDHSSGFIIGAEALVRWNHPIKGLISPASFIPIFEKNGFITKLDMYVFEHVCAFIRSCLDRDIKVVPISSNFSRHDIFQANFAEKLEETRCRYDIPVKYLRLEITESAIVGSSQYANNIIRKLHQFGYVIEMDDFGSGYSSLNVLKDIDLDMVKLDMLFMSDESELSRGGTILSSVVRMAKWLGLPVVAEGVETVRQADFLKSVGCSYIQGYLYSKPLPKDEYEKLLCTVGTAGFMPQMKLIDKLNANSFWDPQSLETLIFSNYVGGAAIFEYDGENIEILRVNQKYLQEIEVNLTEHELLSADFLSYFDEDNRNVYFRMLDRAIETLDEQECETWRIITSSCCPNEEICVRSTVRMIGKSENSALFYAMIRNITAEKNRFAEMTDIERRFRMASEQVNIYFWEYTVATKEMRPCFRCMRDLGLPALVPNYPEPAIEMGIFPPEVADMYRDWHEQIANGASELEAVIPLTVGRVPFHVRYTTEFDDNGKPVKAYGSAALVVD